jgi:hypothetical protein
MADDTNLRVGVTIDTSCLRSGVDGTQAAVEKLASGISDSFSRVERAPESVQSTLTRLSQSAIQATT